MSGQLGSILLYGSMYFRLSISSVPGRRYFRSDTQIGDIIPRPILPQCKMETCSSFWNWIPWKRRHKVLLLSVYSKLANGSRPFKWSYFFIFEVKSSSDGFSWRWLMANGYVNVHLQITILQLMSHWRKASFLSLLFVFLPLKPTLKILKDHVSFD